MGCGNPIPGLGVMFGGKGCRSITGGGGCITGGGGTTAG